MYGRSLNALNLLSLEGLLAILRSLADACDAAGESLKYETASEWLHVSVK